MVDDTGFRERKKAIREKHTPVVTGGGKGGAPTGTFEQRQARLEAAKPQEIQRDVFGGGASPAFMKKLGGALAPTDPTAFAPTKLPGFGGDVESTVSTDNPYAGTIAGLTDAEKIIKGQELKNLGLIYGVGGSIVSLGYLGISYLLGTAGGVQTTLAGGRLAGGALKTTTLLGGGGGAANTVSVSLFSKILAAAGLATFGVSLGVGILGDKVFSMFIPEESSQDVGFAYNQAMQQGDIELASQLLEEDQKVIDFAKNNNGAPFFRTIKAFDEFFNTKQITHDARVRLLENEQKGITKWDQIREQKLADEKASTDYYNQQRVLAEERVIALRTEAAEAGDRRAARRNEKEALFWAEYKEQQRIFEQEQAEWMAAFWLDYFKQKLKLQEQAATGGRSTLGFGIFR